MSDKGIIFSAPMVRALLDGRKTQTRRLLANAPQHAGWKCDRTLTGFRFVGHNGSPSLPCNVTYAAGDRLYVREANELTEENGSLIRRHIADGTKIQWSCRAQAAWIEEYSRRHCPSIHMPRWASRMWLAVTDVRVQRLQECSEADAVAEGIIGYEPTDEDPAEFSYIHGGLIWNDAREAYAALWNTLHTAEGERWEDNPWVVAVSFDVHEGNIDAVPA